MNDHEIRKLIITKYIHICINYYKSFKAERITLKFLHVSQIYIPWLLLYNCIAITGLHYRLTGAVYRLNISHRSYFIACQVTKGRLCDHILILNVNLIEFIATFTA